MAYYFFVQEWVWIYFFWISEWLALMWMFSFNSKINYGEKSLNKYNWKFYGFDTSNKGFSFMELIFVVVHCTCTLMNFYTQQLWVFDKWNKNRWALKKTITSDGREVILYRGRFNPQKYSVDKCHNSILSPSGLWPQHGLRFRDLWHGARPGEPLQPGLLRPVPATVSSASLPSTSPGGRWTRKSNARG